MRTTVDLPEDVHRRAKELAAARGQSMSAFVADLAVRGLATVGEPITISRDPMSGLPVTSLGHAITADQVAEVLDDE